MIYFKHSNFFLIIILIFLSFLCWGGLIIVRGIYFDDWEWFWLYLNSSGLGEYSFPFKCMSRELIGFISFCMYKLIDIFSDKGTQLIHTIMFFIHTSCTIIIYYIFKLLYKEESSLLAFCAGVLYLVNPLNSFMFGVLFHSAYEILVLSYLLSILFTILAFKYYGNRFKFFIFYLLSLVFSCISMAGLESFILLEFSRLFLIVFLLWDKQFKGLFAVIRKGLLFWSPFLLGTIILGVKRLFLVKTSGFWEEVNAIHHLVINFDWLVKTIFYFSYSLYYMFISSWTKSIAYIFESTDKVFVAFFLMIVIFYTALLLITKTQTRNTINEKNKNSIINLSFLILLGLIMLILGILPYNIIGYHPYGSYMSRHATVAKIGFSIFLPSLFFLVYYYKLITKKILFFIFSLIIFLGVFHAHKVTNAFINDWQQQRSFWWQFVWRVPDIKDKTLLYFNMHREESDRFGQFIGQYEISAPFNILYAKKRDKSDFVKNFATSFALQCLEKKGIGGNSFSMGYKKFYHQNLLVASFDKGYLDLNDEIDKTDPRTKTNIKPLIANSSSDCIIYEDNDAKFPFRWIIGPEPKKVSEMTFGDKMLGKILFRSKNRMPFKDWRYYYQKGKLLLYKGDFKGVTELYNEAERLGVVDKQSYKYLLPFIKSFYIVGDIDKAESLLRGWALSTDGSKEKALAFLESIKKINNNSVLHAEIEREINKIF